MKREKQLDLFKDKRQAAFGGCQLTSHPKRKRPLSTKYPIHLVLRSDKAWGERSFLWFQKDSRRIFEKTAAKHGLKIYKYANVGNHFHVILRLGKRFKWKPFICELTSRLAALVDAPTKFWPGRPFTRIVHGWGRNFRTAIGYLILNQLEAAGVLTRRDIKAYNSA